MTETQGAVPRELHVTEIDGIPAVWADVPGPFAAGLLLRMGYADEPLALRGHIHMLEHLALHGLGRPGEHSNGHVDATTMLLHTSGAPEDVADFLGNVTHQLVDPPVARLEDEKGVLRTEASRRGGHPFSELQVWRWGMRTYGLESAEEMGLAAMTAESLRAWSRRFVGRNNAALWFTGPPPAGLSVRLPEGERMRAPDARRCAVPALPAFYRSQAPVVAIHALIDRDWNGPAVARIVANRLVDDLRTRQAAAYSPQAGYQPLGADVAALLTMSDIVQGQTDLVVERVLAALAELGEPATAALAEEIAAHRADVLRSMEATGGAHQPPSAAWDLLHGREPQSVEATREGLDRLTPDTIGAAARAASATALAQVPRSMATPSGWEMAPDSALVPVEGETLEHRDTDARLVVGPAGVTLRESGTVLTVRYSATAAVGAWDDGGRVLIGDDGIRLVIEPTMWQDGERAAASIDVAVAQHARVALGSRAAEAIPRPLPLSARLRRSWRSVLAGGVVVVYLVGLFTVAAAGYDGVVAPALGSGAGMLTGIIVAQQRKKRLRDSS